MHLDKTDRLPVVLLAIYAAFSVVMGIDPLYREDWALETILPAVAFVIFIYSYRQFRFSNLAYAALFIFLMIHTVRYGHRPARAHLVRRGDQHHLV